ncbi:MAG: ABC transporter permease [Hyphomicrobiales bacterium]
MSVAIEAPVPESAVSSWRPERFWRSLVRFTRRQPLGAFGLVVLALIVVMAVFADFVRTSDPTLIGAGPALKGPSAQYWFGTNREGQDVWSRVLYGARPTLIVATLTVVFGLGGGMLLGTLSGYLRGWVDFGISRLAEFIFSFPPIIVGIIVATAMKPGMRSVIVGISIVVVASSTRIMRAAVLQQREMMYVEAARVLGASDARIMFRHIIPNTLPLGIVLMSALLPTAILFESSLTFLGFGLPPGEPSWGADLSSARRFVTLAPWLAIFPGVALSLTILAFNLLGDSLRDVLDPRLRGTGV